MTQQLVLKGLSIEARIQVERARRDLREISQKDINHLEANAQRLRKAGKLPTVESFLRRGQR